MLINKPPKHYAKSRKPSTKFTYYMKYMKYPEYEKKPFCAGYFLNRVSQTTCPAGLMISASQEARITGVSHQCLARPKANT
jgi:hypothetical protein